MWRNRRLQTKLLSVFVGIGLLAVSVTGWQGYYSAKRALEQASFNALTAIREVKKRQIEAYFAQLRHQIVAFAENDMIIEAMQQFQAAFYQVPHDLPATNAPLADSASALHAFYRNVFLDRLMTANETLSVDIQRYLPHDDITTMLQSAYIAQNPHPLGEKDRLLSVEDGSAYGRVHARYHRLLQSYLGKFGYYDIFLIDATTGHVVYTVFKEVDFAANLLTGPLQETTLGQVFRTVRQAPNGFVTLVDFAPYLPSYNAPAAFIATPIFAGTQRLGVLAIQVPIDTIDAIMTGGRRWKHEGLGDSGETYLVGVDYTMRSNSRFLLETPEAFWAQVTQRGTAPDVLRAMRFHNTTILLQEVRTEASLAALQGRTQTQILADYRGVPVLSAYAPLTIPDVQWAILSEIDAAETFYPVDALRQQFLLTAGLLGLAVAGLAVVLSRTMVSPIRRLIAGMGMFGHGALSYRIPVTAADEVGQLAAAFNQMAEELQHTTVSKAYVDNILTSMHDALLVLTPTAAQTPVRPSDAVIVRANPAACALLGYAESELLGLPISQVLPDPVAPAAWLEDVLQHGHIGSRETLYHVRDGRQVPLLFSSAVMRGPAEALEGIVWIAQDLQEIKALEARHQFVRDTFGRYVTEDVVASVLDTPEGLRLGGETRTVTIVMSDLRGFTALAERLTPAQVVAFLNRYLETMVECITHYQGTIDEIIGDGILVIFGAPIARHDDAPRAVACAVAMQLAMDEVNAQNRREGLPEVGMGIGIHTGEVVAGNIGSHKRTKYGVVGSAVNMTGRIESYTTGGQILISEATHTAGASLVRLAGEMTIEPKGAQAPMTIYDVGGIGGPYNLFLPRHTAALVPLATPIALRYAVLEAKHVGAVAGTGHLVQLSATQGELHADRALAAMSDLRIRLFDTTGAEIAGDLYAKVMHATTADARRCLVHFTAQSPEVTAFFHQALPSSIPEEG